MAIVVIARCSSVAGLLGMNDAEWKGVTRTYSLLVIAEYCKIPVRIGREGKYTVVSLQQGKRLSVSGHIMSAVLFSVLRGPIYDSGLNGVPDLFSTFKSMLDNQSAPSLSNEPSYAYPAWHSWLEFAAGVLAGIRAICIVMKVTDVKISRRRALFMKLVVKSFWRKIRIGDRTRIDLPVPDRDNDPRFSR